MDSKRLDFFGRRTPPRRPFGHPSSSRVFPSAELSYEPEPIRTPRPNSFGPTSGEPKWPNPFGPTLGDRTPQRALAEPTSNRSPSTGQPSFFGPLSGRTPRQPSRGRTLQMADPSARRTPPASPSAELCYKSELHWTNCRLQQDRTAPSSPYRTPCGPRLASMAPTIHRTTPSSPYRTPCGPRHASMAPTIHRTTPSSPYRTPCRPTTPCQTA